MTAALHHGDCLEVLGTMGDGSVDAIITDPPYGLSFMGKGWDHSVPGDMFWRKMWRVLKPGGHLLAFGGTRTHHRLTCAIEDAGFSIRDCLMWLYGSGFPKSLDVSKAIDRQRHDREEVYRVTAWVREARDAAGIGNAEIDAAFGFHGMAGHWTSGASQPAVPTLDQVPKLLDVLGDPDVPEEIAEVLIDSNGMRGEPGEAWFRREVLGTRTGVDTTKQSIACARDAQGLEKSTTREFDITAPATEAAQTWDGWGTALKPAWEPIILARKALDGTVAANVVAHGTGALNLDASRIEIEEGDRCIGGASAANSDEDALRFGTRGYDGEQTENTDGRWPANVLLDEEAAAMLGGASRFFYTSKTSVDERTIGGRVSNNHPTVKPADLMGYLCTLITPPGRKILDPFMGSGSTGVAALRLGFEFVGIEKESEYITVAEARIREDAPLYNETVAHEAASPQGGN